MYLPYKYTEKEDFEEGFAQYYHENIVPLAKRKDRGRPRRQIFHFVNITAALISGLGASYFIIKSAWFAKAAQGNRRSGNLLLLPPMFCWWFIVHSPRRRYFQSLKEEFVPKILKFYGSFVYSESGTINEDVLKLHTGYYAAFNLFSCEDVISFEKNGLYCKILERTFWDIKKPTGKVFIYIKTKHSFKADAVIISKDRDKHFRRIDRRLVAKRNLKPNPNPLLMAQRFSEYFDLYVSDSRTVNFMSEKFIKALFLLNSAFDKDGMVFSVRENSILIELESKGNLFEICTNYGVPVANQEDIRNFLFEITTALNLVDAVTESIYTPPDIKLKGNTKILQENSGYQNEMFEWQGRD